MKETYTHSEVQALINSIIHQDSLGDILFCAGQIMKVHQMKMIDPRKNDDSDEDSDYHWGKFLF